MNMGRENDFNEEDNIPFTISKTRNTKLLKFLDQVNHEFNEWYNTQCKDF